jgi:hypothetical protein
MTIPREDNLAWDLVEDYRQWLTTEECTAAFVNLGVGDYQEVVRAILNSLARQQKALDNQAAARIRAWIDCYDTDQEFAVLLGLASDSDR